MAPDYLDVLANLKTILNAPAVPKDETVPLHCRPCEVGTLPFSKEKAEKLIASSSGWVLVEDKKIVKEFKFADSSEAKYFLDLVSLIAEEQGHHPTLTLIYNKLKVTLTTHAAGGLTENDFIMAKHIDELAG